MTITVRVSGHAELGALARRLRAASGGGLQRDLTAGVRRVAPAAVTAVRAAWLTVDVTSSRGGGSSSGLRRRVAAATRATSTGRGVRVEVEPSAVDPRYGRSLTFGLNGMGRWRHPVFGNTSAWTQQYRQEVFGRTLRGREPLWRAELERVCEITARRIEG